jgi:hypothetical protein
MNAKTRMVRLSAVMLIAPIYPAAATVAVVSNLQEAGQASSILRDSSGVPLPTGSVVKLVTFPGKSAAEISALAGGGNSALIAAAVSFAESSAVGAGGNGAGWFEFQTGAPLGAPLENPHVLVTKGTTELLLLRLPVAIPADELAGPEGHIAVHLDDAEVVYGSRDASGFSTAVSPVVVDPTPFEAWIDGELGEETPEAELLPEADADRDGVANLMEYATGSDPGDGGSRFAIRLRRSPEGTHFVQYLRRTGDASLVYTAERLLNVGAGPWIALEGSPTAPAEAPTPAPVDFEWAEQTLPEGTSGYARLRVELVGP